MADKVANARSLVADLAVAQTTGQTDEFWARFRGKDAIESRERQLWFYGSLANAFDARRVPPDLEFLRLEFRRAVGQLSEMAGRETWELWESGRASTQQTARNGFVAKRPAKS
ncbi:MAG TPA: hypothetical protein VG815_19650 [Chloroflexota bacterium]|nr:hypothetical protein [Chloroflexota bacterium]